MHLHSLHFAFEQHIHIPIQNNSFPLTFTQHHTLIFSWIMSIPPFPCPCTPSSSRSTSPRRYVEMKPISTTLPAFHTSSSLGSPARAPPPSPTSTPLAFISPPLSPPLDEKASRHLRRPKPLRRPISSPLMQAPHSAKTGLVPKSPTCGRLGPHHQQQHQQVNEHIAESPHAIGVFFMYCMPNSPECSDKRAYFLVDRP